MSPSTSQTQLGYLPPSRLLPKLAECRFTHRPLDSSEASKFARLEVHLVDLSAIRLKLRQRVPLVHSPRLAGGTVDRSAFRDLLVEVERFKAGDSRSVSYPLLLFAVGADLSALPKSLREECHEAAIVLLDRSDLAALLDAEDRDKFITVLARCLRRDLQMEALHPYIPRHPAVAGAFFGRKQLIQKVLKNPDSSGVIVGNRRMGKTSLLLELERRLREQGTRTLKLSGLNKYTPEQVGAELAGTFLGPNQEEAFREGRRGLTIDELPNKIADAAAAQGQRFAIFYDEIDRVIEHDEPLGWPVLRTLRVLKEHYSEHCRVILAGFRLAMAKYDELADTHNPLANFGMRLWVTRFDRPEREEMIREPLRLLGLDLNNDLYNVIDRATTGMPELIQICCKGLIAAYEADGRLPSADEFDGWIFDQEDYRSAVRYTFVRNTNSFERLVALLLIDDALATGQEIESYQFDASAIRTLLAGIGLTFQQDRPLDEIIRHLSTASIIERRPNDVYCFSLPALGRFFGERDRRQASIADALAEVATDPRKESWLSEPTDPHPSESPF